MPPKISLAVRFVLEMIDSLIIHRLYPRARAVVKPSSARTPRHKNEEGSSVWILTVSIGRASTKNIEKGA